MTTPTQDRDITATLSAPRGEPAAEPHPLAICADDEAAVDSLMRRCPGAHPPDKPQPQPLTVAAREALRLLVDAGHSPVADEHDDSDGCVVCSEPWPCEVEQARRILADALDPNTEAGAAALAAIDSLEASR